MEAEVIRVGPSIKIESFEKILKEREGEVKVSYRGGQEFPHNLDLTPYQIVVKFTEEEFSKLQVKASNEGKKLSELVHDLVLLNSSLTR